MPIITKDNSRALKDKSRLGEFWNLLRMVTYSEVIGYSYLLNYLN